MKWKRFISLTFAFIAFTIIGTQTHEFGHYIAAKYFGLNPSLHYQSVDFGDDNNSNELEKITTQFYKEIEAKKDFPLKQKYEYLSKIIEDKDFYSRLWGPLETMITGTIGMLFLLFYRKEIIGKTTLTTLQWLLVFLSLFWLREVFNTFMATILFITKGQKEFYGDEFILSMQLNLHPFVLPLVTAIIGFIICSTVVFKFVPSSLRKIFIAAGFVGGVIGYVLWMYVLGPRLLP
jgi:hypothetical protein